MSKNNKFNKQLWTLGNKIEDELKPHLEEFLGEELFRSDDIYDIMDFKSKDNKLVVEIKGRRVSSTQYETTLLTCGKVIEAEKLMCIDEDTKVYVFFVFTDCVKYIQLPKERPNWNCKRTGTNHIPHFLIPITELIEFEGVDKLKSNQ
tara:strand:+ start:693 stop:1136 length:444 start_codon:yes stop_codon:yes gene_type:complete